MEFITITNDNLEQEHICCAITDKKGESCVSSKKSWLHDRLVDGLVFRKLNERGKVFIEYIPAEHAWCPMNADGYMHINCLWVSGKFKGQGISNALLASCITDAKAQGKHGLTILSSPKKKPFLADPKYLKYKGFRSADTAEPHFELFYLPFTEDAPVPSFKACSKQGTISDKGMVLYYSSQCPHTAKYAPLIRDMAEERGISLELRQLLTTTDAQSAPSPCTTYSFFYNGLFVTNEIFSEKKFGKFLDSLA